VEPRKTHVRSQRFERKAIRYGAFLTTPSTMSLCGWNLGDGSPHLALEAPAGKKPTCLRCLKLQKQGA